MGCRYHLWGLHRDCIGSKGYSSRIMGDQMEKEIVDEMDIGTTRGLRGSSFRELRIALWESL